MPSSHLRMEEATSIVSSKSITNRFGGSEVTDDLDDFVLQIDENEINNEIKTNGLLEDLAMDVIKEKSKVNPEENNKTDLSKLDINEGQPMEWETNGLLDENIDQQINGFQELKDKIKEINNPQSASKEEECAALVTNTSIKSEVKEQIIDEELKKMFGGGISCAIEKNQPKEAEGKVAGNKNENKFNSESLESVDKELDCLLSTLEDIPSDKPHFSSEPNPPINVDTELRNGFIENSSQSESVVDKVNSNSSEHSTSDSPLTMHSLMTLKEEDRLSFGFKLPKDIIESESPLKINKVESDKNLESNFVDDCINDKGTQISENTNVINDKSRRKAGSKRESNQKSSNKQKKIKLDKEVKNRKSTTCLKKKLESPSESHGSKKNRKESDLESNKVTNHNIDHNESVIGKIGLLNGQASLNEIKNLKEKILQEEFTEISAEHMKEIKEGRDKLFGNYFEGKTDININRCVLEEIVMTQIIDFLSYKCEIGQLRQKCRILESEQIRMNQMVYSLKKQTENAKIIIKKLIDEKLSNKSWTQGVTPLKVTRSVGLQVSTCGSVTLRSKYFDRDRKLARNDRGINKGSGPATRGSLQNSGSLKNKIVSSENKENISSNVKKDAARKDNNSDDVVIVSVTEKNMPTSSCSTIDKGNNVTNKTTIETPKNRIPNENVVRKSLSNGLQTPNKTTAISDTKNPVSENVASKNDPPKTGKSGQNVAEIIDLTDKEDQPVNKSKTSSKSEPSATPSELLTAEISEKLKSATNSHPLNPLIAVNGIKKSSPTSATIKQPVDISAKDDLVNSYDHLPKYPASPKYPANVSKPPRPILRIGKNTSGKQGIMLSWSFEGGRNPSNIEAYQLYAYQESKTSDKAKNDTWKKVGDIKSLPLPMACFLTQFVEGHKYHFIVRAVDTQNKLGDFSLPGSIILQSAPTSAVNDQSSSKS